MTAMAWTDKIFNYCERANDAGLWAEPLNAISNAAFIVAGVLALKLFCSMPKESRRWIDAVLIALTFAIGVGSFLFHTFADRWSVLADVIPITLFIYVYLFLALTSFLQIRRWKAVLVLIGFFVVMASISTLKCSDGLWLLDFSGDGARPCLNGSLSYLPPLGAMLIIGAMLKKRGHPAASHILIAGALFAASLSFRTLDQHLCPITSLGATPLGTHFMWHLLNACVLYCLLRASLFHRGFKTA